MKKMMVWFSLMIGVFVLVGCGNGEDNTESNNPGLDTTKDEAKPNDSADETVAKEETTYKNLPITLADVIRIYDDTHPDTDITSISLDTSFGNFYYTVEGTDDDNEYELDIDATTGKVSNQETDDLDSDEAGGVKRQAEALDLEEIIGIEEVSEIAEKEVNDGLATDWDLKQERGSVVWEVTVEDSSDQETEVLIDAKTGDVLAKEVEE